MAIDGLIILDNTGRPIIQSGFRSSSTAYPLLHIDAFNSAHAKATRAGDIDPVIYVPAYDAGSSACCCHVACGDMKILCPVSGDVDPLFAFAFIQTFIDILYDYFGTVSAATLKDNFDVVYQLLEETLDSGGHPLTTSTNALRDIVLPPTLLSKILSVAGANMNSLNSSSSSGGGSGGGPFSSPIPWRKAGLRYNHNEIYFDMVEELKAVVNKHGTPLSSNVWGRIDTNAKLSGTPDCLLTFSNPHVLADCAFHPCVRLQRWKRDKSLSFVPPDGRFVLLDYRYASTATPTAPGPTNTAPGALAISKDVVAIPFVIKAAVDVEDNGGSFDLTLTSRLSTRAIENLVVEMYLGEGSGNVKCVVGSGSGGAGRGGFGHASGGFGNANGVLGRGLGEVSGGGNGSWGFDLKKRIMRWEIANVPPSSSWTLRGSFSSSISPPRPSHALQIRFEIPSHTFSALKVDQLKVTGEVYKPYKGVRGRSVGDVEWRW